MRLSVRGDDAHFIKKGVHHIGFGGMRGFKSVKPGTQTGLFLAPAIVPRPALQRHFKHVIGNEMRFVSAGQQSGIGRIRAQRAQIFRTGDPGTRECIFHRGAKISDRRDRS